MERKIRKFLHKWKTDKTGKPVIIYGSKQIGKTFSVLEFGEKEYKNTVYFNTENNIEVEDLFRREKSIDKIIANLSVISGETILKDDTLVVLDNLVNNDIVKGMKLFGSDKSKYNIIGITSRREKLNDFKGEEIQFKNMTEMDFEEFLWALDEKNLADLIRECFEKRKTNPFHKVALEYFYEYLMTGGFPEAVEAKINGYTFNKIDAIKQKTLDIYKKEIALNATLIDIPRGIEVINSIPQQLKKANKKFQYGVIGEGRRAKEYESTINYLINNQIVYRSFKIKKVKSPLSSCKDTDSFKLYLTDDGILFSMLHLNKKQLLNDELLKETMYENHVAKTLVESGYPLYYYQSDGKAEVNFVVQNRMGKIIPIEIIARTNSKAKSLSVFMKKYEVEEAFRITENNFQTKKQVRYIPIYAVFCLNTIKI